MTDKKGFTLIELVAVMAIIAILTLLVAGAIVVARRTALRTTNESNGRTIRTALEANFAKKQTYAYPTYVAGETFSVAAAATKLNVTLGSGGCPNGGGVITSAAAANYTITIWDEDCVSGDTDNRVVSGP